MRTTVVLLAAVLLPVAVPAGAQERHEHPDCRGLPFWVFDLMHWHYPEILAELTQLNSPRSRAESDAVARELVRSAADPDPDWVVGQIRTHFEGDIRGGAEAAAQGPCYDASDIDRMVSEAIEDVRQDPDGIARMMAAQTLRLAAHQGGDSSLDPPHGGIPYTGAFEATVLLFEETGRAGTLLMDLDRERAEALFQRLALRPGRSACTALSFLQSWDEENPRPNGLHGPHPSYERLRRESPERCPGLDDPDGG
ncbi:hypothetical protein [Candidatus Palauibacter sp.]|uniref:hypothetical protein n=1 Tax=Candidatus Palauibacter sp. TaxID=3101350 RepID=UPI003B02E189